MDYETMDWELEARRIMRAFGVKGECEFYLERQQSRFFRDKNRLYPYKIEGDYELNVEYDEDARWFQVFHPSQPQQRTSISLAWDGQPHPGRTPLLHAEFLAKGLYALGLLSPEVEAALKLSISAHQKMEWALEYEARNGL